MSIKDQNKIDPRWEKTFFHSHISHLVSKDMFTVAFFMLMVSYPLASLALTQDEYDTAYDYLYDYWRTGDGR